MIGPAIPVDQRHFEERRQLQGRVAHARRSLAVGVASFESGSSPHGLVFLAGWCSGSDSVIGTWMTASSTGSPSMLQGFIAMNSAALSAASPKPRPAGVSLTNWQLAKTPFVRHMAFDHAAAA